MAIELIEVKKLSKSPRNVRRTQTKAACEELKASILAHGILQNLVVVPAKRKCQVIAGGRRLAALQALIAEEKLPEDHAVPCQVATEEQAEEMSLAENTVRQAMHPADEFEAFASLVDQGQTAAQIAERFGVAERHVQQRLRLGRASPELLAAYRAEEIDLECLQAYAVTDDRKRQIDLYRSLQGWQRTSAHHIRRCLTEKMTEADDKLAKFVGLKAYEAAGGRTKSDLFGEDVYLEDTALLARLAGEKLEAEAEKLRQDGWGWVEVDVERDYTRLSRFSRIEPKPLNAPADVITALEAAEAEQTRIAGLIDEAYESDEDNQELIDGLVAQLEAVNAELERIEGELASFVDFDPEEKRLAGCLVCLDYAGRFSIERGLVKAEDRKRLAASQPGGGEADEDEEARPSLPRTLIDDLKAYRTQIAMFELAKNPDIAFDLLVFQTARDTLSLMPTFDGPKVSFQRQHVKPSVEGDTLSLKRLKAVREGLPLDWTKAPTERKQFAALRQLSQSDKLRLLAYCTALTLQPKLAPEPGKQQTAYDIALGLTGCEVAHCWRPTAANFLGRLTKGQLLEIGQEVFQGDFTARWRAAKKGELAQLLDRAFAHPEKDERPEVQERLRMWLPEGMGFGGSVGPESAEVAETEAVVRACRDCGCTEEDCSECIERTGEPCHWVEEDLCSACNEPPARSRRGRKAA
jgi:ParB family chromosome partitioning protein